MSGIPPSKTRSSTASSESHRGPPTDDARRRPDSGSASRTVASGNPPASGPLFLRLSCVDGSELDRRRAAVEEIHREDFIQASHKRVKAFLAQNLDQVRAKMNENSLEYTDARAEEILLTNLLVKKIFDTKTIGYTSEKRDEAIYAPVEVVRDPRINVDVSMGIAQYVRTLLPLEGRSDAQLISDGVVREVTSVTTHGLDDFFAETELTCSVYNASNWNDPRILVDRGNLRRVAKLCASACVAYKGEKEKIKSAREGFAQIFGNSANSDEGEGLGDELDIENIDWNM